MNNKEYRTFLTIWFGQLVSRLGTAVTRFALIIWAYEQTDSVTAVALLGFCAFVPMILVSPFAGVWVDRLDRRKIMLLADAGAGATTLILLILFTTGQLQFWHLYIIEALSGLFEAFQGPAYTALTSQLLPKEEYTRASGLCSIAADGGGLIAPFLAGFLLVKTGIASVMIIDLPAPAN
ncbi:MAG: MFS transporter [Chloroflexi bacterium]|nr:MFS transporter [Chloroflexota bacterium]